MHGWGGVLGGEEDAAAVVSGVAARGGQAGSPERVYAVDLHKVGGGNVGEEGVRAHDAGVGEEDVEPAVPLERVADHFLDGLLVGGVELANVDVDLGVQAVDLALVRLEVGGIKVADVDGLGPVLRELVGRGAADAQDGVCAWRWV